MVQFLDIIRFVENVKKDIYIYMWFVNCSLFCANTSCVLSSRHQQRVPFSRSAKFFHSSTADRRIASLFRILAISAINDTCTFCAIFSLFEGSLIIRDILIWFVDNKWKLMEKNLVFVFFWFFVTLAEKSILIIVISQFRCDSSVKKFLNSG